MFLENFRDSQSIENCSKILKQTKAVAFFIHILKITFVIALRGSVEKILSLLFLDENAHFNCRVWNTAI
jgi:hypothetical protein